MERYEINVRLDETVATTQLGTRSYTIHVGDTILQDLEGLLKNDRVQRAVVVSDQAVHATHGNTVTETLKHDDYMTTSIPSGEASKSLTKLSNCS